MSISSLLAIGRIFTHTEISSKKRLLEFIAEKAADELGLVKNEIYNQLLERERLGSTGLGKGIAVPHARLDNLDRTYACFVKLDDPVNYDAIDRQPVDLVFVILIPEASTEEHLKILASLAKLFSDQAVCNQIRESDSAEQILATIQQAEQGPA
jgi:PTS system nitrogen regulatory IIA component